MGWELRELEATRDAEWSEQRETQGQLLATVRTPPGNPRHVEDVDGGRRLDCGLSSLKAGATL